MNTNLTKTINNLESNNKDAINKNMTNKLISLINQDPTYFDRCSEVINLLDEIINDDIRIMYSLFTKKIYDYNDSIDYNSNTAEIGLAYKYNKNIASIRKLLNQENTDDANKDKKLNILYKLEDHITLADTQSSMFSMNTKIYQVVDRLPELEDNIEQSKSEVIMQLISLIGLFTALSFIVFGGFSLINAISIIVEHLPMIHIVMLTSIVGIIIFNLIALFILLVYKIANPKFKDRVAQEDYKSAYGDYILKIIKKTNCIMVGIITISFLIIVCRNPKSLVF